MNRRTLLSLLPGVLVAPRLASATVLPAEAIFTSAKNVWRTRAEAPFITFNLRERYTWRGRTHDNWWSASYRNADRALALRRSIVPDDEANRLRGTSIALNFRSHHGNMHVDTLDTNSDADAFPALDPLIEPNASFGLLRREQTAALVLDGSTVAPGASPYARATAEPSAEPAPAATGETLRELGHVEAVSRDYAIELEGVESVRDADAFHLTLTPMRAPSVYRLRDLWVDAVTYETLRLSVHGLFRGKPYEDARWMVTYVKMAGRNYVQQIRTDDTLRFGLDRFVSGLQFDFVAYEFPETLSPLTFERLL